jgi:DNA-directed RNA polymerase subunit RPC12/RpoP
MSIEETREAMFAELKKNPYDEWQKANPVPVAVAMGAHKAGVKARAGAEAAGAKFAEVAPDIAEGAKSLAKRGWGGLKKMFRSNPEFSPDIASDDELLIILADPAELGIEKGDEWYREIESEAKQRGLIKMEKETPDYNPAGVYAGVIDPMFRPNPPTAMPKEAVPSPTPEPKKNPPMAYCLKCKKKVEVAEPKEKVKKGNVSLYGKCSVCSGKVFKFIGKKKKNPGEIKMPEITTVTNEVQAAEVATTEPTPQVVVNPPEAKETTAAEPAPVPAPPTENPPPTPETPAPVEPVEVAPVEVAPPVPETPKECAHELKYLGMGNPKTGGASMQIYKCQKCHKTFAKKRGD